MQLTRQLLNYFQYFHNFSESTSCTRQLARQQTCNPDLHRIKHPRTRALACFTEFLSWFVIQHTDPSILAANILRMFNEMQSDVTSTLYSWLAVTNIPRMEFKWNKCEGNDFERKIQTRHAEGEHQRSFHPSWKFLLVSFRLEMWWKCSQLPVSIILFEISLAICKLGPWCERRCFWCASNFSGQRFCHKCS